MGISATQLQIYDDCPYKYYLSYIKSLDAMMYDITVFDVGTQVHDAIDEYYRKYFNPKASKEFILYEVYGILKKNWDNFLAPEKLKYAYDCIVNFSDFEFNRLQKDTYKPLTELKIGADGYYGIVDFFNPANKKAIDWKTGKNAYLSRSYRIQSVVYKILLDKEFKTDLEVFNFRFLRQNVPIKVDLKSKKMEEIFDFVSEGKNNIIKSRKNGEWEKNPRTNKMCRWCDFRFYCKRLGI